MQSHKVTNHHPHIIHKTLSQPHAHDQKNTLNPVEQQEINLHNETNTVNIEHTTHLQLSVAPWQRQHDTPFRNK